jgi:hypothetical protein
VDLPETGALDLPVPSAGVPLGPAGRFLRQVATGPHHPARRRPPLAVQPGGGHRAGRVDRDVDGARARPAPLQDRGRRRLHGDRAVVEDDDVVRAVPPQPGNPRAVDGEPGPRTPAQRPAGQFLDRHVDVVQPGEAGQLLADHRLLQPPLLRRVDVLPVAAAAPARAAVGAGPLDARRRGLEHLDGVGAAEAGVPVLGHPDDHPLAGQAVPDEDDPPLVPGHAVPAVRHRPDGHLELRAGPAR